MALFGAGELLAMRAAAEAHMPDSATRLAYASSRSSIGAPVASYTAAQSFACGIEWIRNEERLSAPDAAIAVAARMRAPLELLGYLTARDRIRITAIRGEALSPAIDCEIVGMPLPSTSALLLELRRVDDRTA